MNYYKFLDEDGTTPKGNGKWHLPTRAGRPGEWMPAIKGKLIVCENGYHLVRETASDILEWCGAPAMWRVDVRGDMVEADDKIVVRQARLIERIATWNETTARLFACDCAERALTVARVTDERSYNAVSVARRFARGDSTREELAAAWAAAWAAEREWQFARFMQYIRG